MKDYQKIQRELNEKNLKYYKFLSLIGLLAYLMWSFGDYFLVQESFFVTSICLRFFVVVTFIVLNYTLSDSFLIKYHHVLVSFTFVSMAIATEIIIFNSKVVIPYFSSYFLIPFYAATLLLVPFRYFILQFVFFLLLHIYYWDEILKLSLDQKIFGIVMSMTVYFLTSLYALYNYKKMVNALLLEKKINNQTLILRRTNEEKASLIRVLCHDLANTISISHLSSRKLIKILESYIQEGSIEGKDKIESTIKKFQCSMNAQHEILKLVREKEAIDSGKFELVLSPVKLISIFSFVETLFSTSCEEKNIQLKILNPEKLDLCLLVDEKILKNNILQNLLTNAIKFTHFGGCITLSSHLENDGLVTIKVVDNGIGIPKEMLNHIFEYESNISRQGTAGEVGTGFGMPLVYSSVKSLHGEIEIVSLSIDDHQKDHGTSVILKFRRES